MSKKTKEPILFGFSKANHLCQKIGEILKWETYAINLFHFNDGELLVKSPVSVRGRDVFLLQSTSSPANDSLMELLIGIDALKNASAKSINVVIPYFGYARQDRKTCPREPITSKLVANLIKTAGATRVLVVEIHSHPTLGYFQIPIDNISFNYVFCDYIVNLMRQVYPGDPLTIISPDYGGVNRARQTAKILEDFDTNVAILDKRRPKVNMTEIINVLGDVKDRICFILDDMIDTGGTICKAAESVKNKGAKAIYVLATHGVLSGQACTNLEKAVTDGFIKKIVITDTIEQYTPTTDTPGLEVLPIANILATFIKSLHNNESLGNLYEQTNSRFLQSHNLKENSKE